MQAVTLGWAGSFQCRQIGEQNVVAADLEEPCPLDRPASAAFALAMLACLLFPAGVPLFFLAALRKFNVPVLAKEKHDNAILKAMLGVYLHTRSSTCVGHIAGYVGLKEESPVLPQRARDMFETALQCGPFTSNSTSASRATENPTSVSREMLERFLTDVGVEGDHGEEIEDLVGCFDQNQSGGLEWDEFLVSLTEGPNSCSLRTNSRIQNLSEIQNPNVEF